VRLEPLRHWHLLALEPQEAQAGLLPALRDREAAIGVTLLGPGWAVVDGGRTLAAGGFDETSGHYGLTLAWAVLGRGLGLRVLAGLRREVAARLAVRRGVGCEIDPAWSCHRRFAAGLGFTFARVERPAWWGGRDVELWTRAD
jgi:hypothetical protein